MAWNVPFDVTEYARKLVGKPKRALYDPMTPEREAIREKLNAPRPAPGASPSVPNPAPAVSAAPVANAAKAAATGAVAAVPLWKMARSGGGLARAGGALVGSATGQDLFSQAGQAFGVKPGSTTDTVLSTTGSVLGGVAGAVLPKPLLAGGLGYGIGRALSPVEKGSEMLAGSFQDAKDVAARGQSYGLANPKTGQAYTDEEMAAAMQKHREAISRGDQERAAEATAKAEGPREMDEGMRKPLFSEEPLKETPIIGTPSETMSRTVSSLPSEESRNMEADMLEERRRATPGEPPPAPVNPRDAYERNQRQIGRRYGLRYAQDWSDRATMKPEEALASKEDEIRGRMAMTRDTQKLRLLQDELNSARSAFAASQPKPEPPAVQVAREQVKGQQAMLQSEREARKAERESEQKSRAEEAEKERAWRSGESKQARETAERMNRERGVTSQENTELRAEEQRRSTEARKASITEDKKGNVWSTNKAGRPIMVASKGEKEAVSMLRKQIAQDEADIAAGKTKRGFKLLGGEEDVQAELEKKRRQLAELEASINARSA